MYVLNSVITLSFIFTPVVTSPTRGKCLYMYALAYKLVCYRGNLTV